MNILSKILMLIKPKPKVIKPRHIYTLEELEADGELDVFDYEDFLCGDELAKFRSKYKITYKYISSNTNNELPNGSRAFRFD